MSFCFECWRNSGKRNWKEKRGKVSAKAITAKVIAVVIKYSIASQFRFGCEAAVINIKLKFKEVKLSWSIPYLLLFYAIVPGNVIVTFKSKKSIFKCMDSKGLCGVAGSKNFRIHFFCCYKCRRKRWFFFFLVDIFALIKGKTYSSICLCSC